MSLFLSGCYDNQSVDDLGVLSTHALDRGSVGLCQERCGSQGRFALKVRQKKVAQSALRRLDGQEITATHWTNLKITY